MDRTPIFYAAELSLLLRALRFSAEKHGDQRRKDSVASPYINHPIQVAETLWRIGEVRDIAIIIAALLHDTIEDTPTHAAELTQLFGAEITALVLEVSDDKNLPKAERKRRQILHAPYISQRAKQLKLADKICNIADIIHSPPCDWPLQRKRDYLDWSDQVVKGLRGSNLRLEVHYDALLEVSRTALAMGLKQSD